jgi:hypothetical protein
LEVPSFDHEGGVKASIKDKLDGSNGLNGATSSTKNEQNNIIIKIALDTMDMGDFIKLKYMSLSLILPINDIF